MIVEYQVSISIDTATGEATGYILKADGDEMNWGWLADTQFGPFDTATDIGRWVGYRLALDESMKLR